MTIQPQPTAAAPAKSTAPAAADLAATLQPLMTRAREAQAQLEGFSQAQVDAIVQALGRAVHQHAEMLAEMAVTETRMGNVPDKIAKNRNKSEMIWDHLRSVPSVGVIREDAEAGLLEIAEPVGVVAAIVPTTNPSVTAMSNAMFALKARNAVIIAPHPRAKQVTLRTVELMLEEAAPFGLPANAIQVITEPSPALSGALMAACDQVLATGGPGMVRAAYSSGKPAYGVGAGNVPVVIYNTADIEQAVKDIITGKTFDNGVICSSEQAVIMTPDIAGQVMDTFVRNGAYVVDDVERVRLKSVMFGEEGHIQGSVVGQTARTIAEWANITLPEGQDRLLLVPVNFVSPEYPFSSEKMSPVLSFYVRDTFDECVTTAVQVLENGGMGHTAAIHAADDAAVRQFALAMKASRVIVNQPSATTAGGSRQNSLLPTTTMGCGTWGGNIATDNISVRQLMNVKRVAYKLPEARDTAGVL